jgi:DNA-cytosine methyltransferase
LIYIFRDLFCGCGGLSLGLKNAGFEIVYAVDADSEALETFKLNMPETIALNTDINTLLKKVQKKQSYLEIFRELSLRLCRNKKHIYKIDQVLDIEQEDDSYKFLCTLQDSDHEEWLSSDMIADWEPIFIWLDKKFPNIPSRGEIDVLIGGPPCQSFSSANRFRHNGSPFSDKRNQLVISFVEFVTILQPQYILIENVTNMLNSPGVFNEIKSRLGKLGYEIEASVLLATHYGLPQTRARTFIWGARDKNVLPHYPKHTHACRNVTTLIKNTIRRFLTSYPQLKDSGPLPQVTIRDIISDLPSFNGGGTRAQQPYTSPPQTKYQERLRMKPDKEQLTHVTDHDSFRCVSRKSLIQERMDSVPLIPGANYKDLPLKVLEKLSQSTINFRKERCLARATWFGMFATVVTTMNPQSEPVLHPTQKRLFSVRELARAQGFPDWFKFCGPMKSRIKQVGNAVPVIIAQRLGEQLMRSHSNYLASIGKFEKQDPQHIIYHIKDTIEGILQGKQINDERIIDNEELNRLMRPLPEDIRDPTDEEINKRQKEWKFKKHHVGKYAWDKKKKRKRCTIDSGESYNSDSDSIFGSDSDVEVIEFEDSEEEEANIESDETTDFEADVEPPPIHRRISNIVEFEDDEQSEDVSEDKNNRESDIYMEDEMNDINYKQEKYEQVNDRISVQVATNLDFAKMNRTVDIIFVPSDDDE